MTACLATFNGEDTLHACLELLETSEVVSRILVLDNGSTDGTRNILKSFPSSKLHVQFSSYNTGFAKGYNTLLKKALDYDDFILCLNQDIYIQSNDLEKLVSEPAQLTKWGVLSPVHLNSEGDASEYYFRKIMEKQGIHFSEIAQNQRIQVNFINAACWLINPLALREVGGFDPIFHTYGEDLNWCQRSKLRGYPIFVALDSQVRHVKPPKSYGNSGKTNRKVYVSHKLAQAVNPLQSVSSVGIILKEAFRVVRALLLVRTEGVRRHGRTTLRLIWLIPKILKRRRKSFYSRDRLFLHE